MSLILEALKKSEANRRLGQAPDLGTPFTPARHGRSPAWALLVIVLALGAGLWWWFGRATPAPAPAAAAPAVAAAPAPDRVAAPAQSHEARQQEDKRIFDAARRRDSNAQAAAEAGRNEQIWVAAQRHDATGRPAKRPARKGPALAPMARTPRETASAQAARAPKMTDKRDYTPQPHPDTAPPPQPQPHPDAALPPRPHPEATAPPPGTPKLDIPTYYDLPFATRKALPQLNLSMHVYAADPKQRFVILDGTRMVEGDATTDAVTLREIRSDGVVLEFEGQRFFFPRDGL
jgi:general secretion pathway protein B